MNIFVLDNDPVKAAQAMDCVRVPKMVTESAQMMASALRRHDATDEQMPLTQKGTPYKGAYKHHPCTIWAGDSRANFYWLADHALALCEEYTTRFGKTHACEQPIKQMNDMSYRIRPTNVRVLTPFALAMPDEYRPRGSSDDILYMEAEGDDAVKAYRAYYHSKADSKGGVHYRHTSPPDWWMGVTV